MKGGNLKKIIGTGPKYIPEDRAKVIAKKILEATAIMHSREIIHQDLKPSVRISLNLSPSLSISLPSRHSHDVGFSDANWKPRTEHPFGR